MDIILFFITLFCCFGSLIVVFCLTPYFTPRNICFGVRIPEEAVRSVKIVKLRNNYIIFSAVSGVVFAVTAAAIKTYSAVFACLFCFCMFSLLHYLVCARTVKSMQLEENSVKQMEVFIENLPKSKAFSVWWELILIVFPISLFIMSYIFKISYAVPCFSAVIFVAVFAIHLCIVKFPQYADAERSLEKSDKIKRRWSVMSFLSGAVLQLSALAIYLPNFNVLLNENIIFAIPFVAAVVIVVISIISGLKK